MITILKNWKVIVGIIVVLSGFIGYKKMSAPNTTIVNKAPTTYNYTEHCKEQNLIGFKLWKIGIGLTYERKNQPCHKS